MVYRVSTDAEIQGIQLSEDTPWKLQTLSRPGQQILYFDSQLQPLEHQVWPATWECDEVWYWLLPLHINASPGPRGVRDHNANGNQWRLQLLVFESVPITPTLMGVGSSAKAILET